MNGDTQFINELGSTEALFSFKLLVQKRYDQTHDGMKLIIDYQKAFDNVRHESLLERLQ